MQSLPQLRLVLLDAPGAWLTRCASASLKRPSFVMNGEEMGQSDLSRRIAHGDSGYPVLAILNRFVASPAASTKADIGPPAFISNVGSPAPARTWTYRVGIGDATEHRINHSPVRGQRIAGDPTSEITTQEITARGAVSAFVEAAGRCPSRASRAVPD